MILSKLAFPVLTPLPLDLYVSSYTYCFLGKLLQKIGMEDTLECIFFMLMTQLLEHLVQIFVY